MNRTCRAWLAIALLFSTLPARADNETIGSIEAVVDGQPRSWHIIAVDGKVAGTGALWMIPSHGDGGTALAVLGGFESTDIVVGQDPETGTPTVSAEGSQISINFEFPLGASSTEVTVPGPGTGSVLLMPTAGNYSVMHSMEEGTISVTRIEAEKTGASRFEGTFSGRLSNRDGEALGAITDGRFEVDGARFFQPK